MNKKKQLEQLQRLVKLIPDTGQDTKTGENGKLINVPRVQMMRIQEGAQAQPVSGIFFEGCNLMDQACPVSIRLANVFQNIAGGYLFKLDIAALGQIDEPVPYFLRNVTRRIGKQGLKFIFKIVFSVCLADEVQHGQAFLTFGQTQTASELLQEYGQ